MPSTDGPKQCKLRVLFTIVFEEDEGLKVYLDDERSTPLGWRRVYWPAEAIELLKTGEVTEISLDHDLGDDAKGTGYDVILWIEEQVVIHGMNPPIIHVHSANTAARERMLRGVQAIKSRIEQQASSHGDEPCG